MTTSTGAIAHIAAEREITVSEDKTITLSKHEAVVDRDWLHNIGELLLKTGHKEIGQECVDIGTSCTRKCKECGETDEDELGSCEICEGDICMECDAGRVKEGWVCPGC